MAPIKAGKYEYRPESLIGLRQQLGLKQKKMADLLGIPANTLSRWETGATTPDAESLAAVYSLAMERGVTPKFFQRKRPAPKPSKGRSRLLVMWDFQNVGASANEVPNLVSWIREELNRRFSNASYQRFKAFASPNQTVATDKLLSLGWRIWEDDEDIDDEIIAQGRSDCGQEPKDTTLVLITRDGGYANFITDLEKLEVQVYLVTPADRYSTSLVKRISSKRWIRLPQNMGR